MDPQVPPVPIGAKIVKVGLALLNEEVPLAEGRSSYSDKAGPL